MDALVGAPPRPSRAARLSRPARAASRPGRSSPEARGDRVSPLTSDAPARLFEEQLDLIERLLRGVCRRAHCGYDETEEFASWAKLRMLESDYAVLRKFRGGSSLATYLTVVVANLFRDYRIAQWGKWRPSADAKRLGAEAIELERLIHRDGRSVDEAVRTLAVGRPGARPERELRELAGRLPHRPPRRFEGEAGLAELTAPGGADDRVAEADRGRSAERAERLLAEALEELPAEDRLILKLRFTDGFAVPRIASALGLAPRPVYGRLERALAVLRRALERRDLRYEQVADLVGWSGQQWRWADRLGTESRPTGPSKPQGAGRSEEAPR